MKNTLSKTLAAIAAGMLSLAAHAEGPEPDYTVTYNVGVVSDYRVRGIAQTSKVPAIQGGIDFAHKDGLYLGTAVSTVKWVKDLNGATKGSYELDLYGGYRAELAPNFTYDVGVITYRYPGNNSGVGGVLPAGTFDNANTVEIYGALSYKTTTFKYNRSTGNFLGNLDSSGSQYFDLSTAIDLTNGFTLTPHIGRQLIANQPGNLGDYSDIALTLTKDFGNGLVVTIAALGTNADKVFYTDTNGRFLGNKTLVVGAKYSF